MQNEPIYFNKSIQRSRRETAYCPKDIFNVFNRKIQAVSKFVVVVFWWRKIQTTACEKLTYSKFPLTLQLSGKWEMGIREIQDLDLNQAKWILEPELSKLELYVHFCNCVTHGCTVLALRIELNLSGKGKEKALGKNPL